jgi:protein-tyrosine phosphatase
MSAQPGWPADSVECGEGEPLASPLRRLARITLRADARRLFLHDCWRTLAGEPPLPAPPLGSIAVLCRGNLCRSPFAAALLEQRLPALRIASFGLGAGDDHPVDPRARWLAREWGCELSEHRTRRLGDAEARAADLLLVMDAVQGAEVSARWPALRARVRLLGDYLPARPFAIADPWRASEPVWRDTYARIALAVGRLASRLEAQR